jgi:lysophospholipase L1-like esterase
MEESKFDKDLAEEEGRYPLFPVSFHKAFSLLNVQVNTREDSSTSQTMDDNNYVAKHRVMEHDHDCEEESVCDNNNNDDDDDDDCNHEFDALLLSSNRAAANAADPTIPCRKLLLQPFSITTPQQDCNDTLVRIQIPSVRLPPRRGSLCDRYYRKGRPFRLSSWWECCFSNHHFCFCYKLCGTGGWVNGSCRMLVLVFIVGGIVCISTQVIWQKERNYFDSQHKRPSDPTKYDSPSLVVVNDDNVVDWSSPSSSSYYSSSSSSSRISGDYSTVQCTHDLMVLAANVPELCSAGVVTLSSNNDNNNNNNNRRKKNVHPRQDCPCAVLEHDDAINSRTTPMRGIQPGWDETWKRNVRLANLSEPLFIPDTYDRTGPTITDTTKNLRPNVVFLGDSITERWYGTRLGKHDHADLEETHNVFVELFQRDVGSDEHCIRGLALGIAGDQTPNLLWRLENGELPIVLQPRIFVLLIGTNDLSKDWCSAENVIVGIVRIVELLLTERPTATVLLHGLLPRTYDEEGYLNERRITAGRSNNNSSNWGNFFRHHDSVDNRDKEPLPNFWPDIKIINNELRGECQMS